MASKAQKNAARKRKDQAKRGKGEFRDPPAVTRQRSAGSTNLKRGNERRARTRAAVKGGGAGEVSALKRNAQTAIASRRANDKINARLGELRARRGAADGAPAGRGAATA